MAVLCTDGDQHSPALAARLDRGPDGRWRDAWWSKRVENGLDVARPPVIEHGGGVIRCRRSDCSRRLDLAERKLTVLLDWAERHELTHLDISMPWAELLPVLADSSRGQLVAEQVRHLLPRWRMSKQEWKAAHAGT